MLSLPTTERCMFLLLLKIHNKGNSLNFICL